MIDMLKNLAMEKGMSLMKSPMVSKIMASEKTAQLIETAMTVPFRVSSVLTAQKEKLVEMFDLATQEDVDDLRRTVTRMESTISELQKRPEDFDQ